jgi:3',5'-cyclic AMP phosphodiesterase CpdA
MPRPSSPSSSPQAATGAGRAPARPDAFTLVHISDLHAGSPYFVPSLMDRAVVEINELAPDAVVCTGDLTEMGFRQDYLVAREYLERIVCPRLLVIPGNHDSRNVGYVHFEELFGERYCVMHEGGISIIGVDSTEPDLDYGTIGRARYRWLDEQFATPAWFRVFMLHHHLLPVPGTGRERNMVYDAGDTLEVLQRCKVNLVLAGHKHVPYAWRLENLFVVNAGTACSLRLRGETRPCYNIVTIGREQVRILRKYPFHGTETIIEFSPATLAYEKYGPGEAERDLSG